MRKVFIFILLLTMIGTVFEFRPKQSLASSLLLSTKTACVAGMASVYPCNQIDLLANLPLSQLGGNSSATGSDIWGWTDPRDGREYATITLSNGTAFVDVTNPLSPIYLGHLPTATINNIWRDVKVYDGYAYIVADRANDHGIQIFDLKRLREIVTPGTLQADGYYDGVTDSHNIVINEESGFAYAVGNDGGSIDKCNRGIHIIDLKNRLEPTFAGCFSADGYTHDAQCVIYSGPDPDYDGAEICFASNEDTVTIVDVSDKANTAMISRTAYTGASYTHQGWLTEDQRFLLVNDEVDERLLGHNTRTYIWDVADLDAPLLIGHYDGPTGAIDHNLYIHQGLVYEANYRAGLRVLDSADIANGNLTEIAYFDVYPDNDATTYSGAWSSYPFFESGTILVSDIEQGLFTLRHQLDPSFRLAIEPSRIEHCGEGTITAQLTAESIAGLDATIDLISDPTAEALMWDLSAATQQPETAQVISLTVSAEYSGTYDIPIAGQTVTQTHSTSLLLHQVADIMPLVPAAATEDVDTQPLFEWSGGSGEYRIQVAEDAAFSQIVIDSVVSEPNFRPNIDLNLATTYYWRVSAESGSCVGKPILTNHFTTRLPDLLFIPIINSEH